MFGMVSGLDSMHEFLLCRFKPCRLKCKRNDKYLWTYLPPFIWISRPNHVFFITRL